MGFYLLDLRVGIIGCLSDSVILIFDTSRQLL
jgi:hypothetical protein